jgi:hypothetical protein
MAQSALKTIKKGCAENKLRIKCNKCDVYYLTQSKENY